MKKEKLSFSDRFSRWFTNHPWLKIIALLLAVMVWFYAKVEIGKF
ncbi:MAG: hypothetical protein PHN57_08635 [Candidatus Omnitrophica bacterium]|nr:hypothetical protein [Candidatus Omnitrophota bacterium]